MYSITMADSRAGGGWARDAEVTGSERCGARCSPVESQCAKPDEMIWPQVGTQLQPAIQLLRKTLTSLP